MNRKDIEIIYRGGRSGRRAELVRGGLIRGLGGGHAFWL